MINLRLRKPPTWLVYLMLIATVATFVPIAAIARARYSTSPNPRIHLVQDMGSQPRFGPQQPSPIFADRRADRPTVEGTVSRTAVVGEDHYTMGFTPGANGLPTKNAKNEAVFLDGYPKQITVNDALLARGRDRFTIYCSGCHGQDGSGHGMVDVRAAEIGEPKWVTPFDLRSNEARARNEGHLFNTITNGIRNMGGLGGQIPVEDRWAIVSYVRALQYAQAAPASALSQEQQNALRGK